MQDLDRAKLEKYIARRKEGRPNAPYWNMPFEQIIDADNCYYQFRKTQFLSPRGEKTAMV